MTIIGSSIAVRQRAPFSFGRHQNSWMADSSVLMGNKPVAWSCEEKKNLGCRNPHGCHCREIADLQAQVARLTRERDQAEKDRHAVTRLAVQMKIANASR